MRQRRRISESSWSFGSDSQPRDVSVPIEEELAAVFGENTRRWWRKSFLAMSGRRSRRAKG